MNLRRSSAVLAAGALAAGLIVSAAPAGAGTVPVISTGVGGPGRGPARNVEQFPNGVATGPGGAVYVGDQFSLVRQFTETSTWERVAAGIGGAQDEGYSGDGGPAVTAQLSTVKGLTVDHAGNVVIADSNNARVRVVAKSSGTFYGRAMTKGDIYTIAGNGTSGFAGDGGPATAAELDFPWDVAVDGAGNVVIADSNNARVRVVAKSSGTFYGQAMTAGDIYTIAGDGTDGVSGDGGPATAAELDVDGLTVDRAGNVVIADTFGSRVRVVAVSSGTFYGQAMTVGDIYTVAGDANRGFSGDGGPATSASLNAPMGVGADGAGNLLIADSYNNRVRVVAGSTGTFYGQAMTAGDIYTIAGNGSPGTVGNGGPATAAKLQLPMGVAFDSSGNLLIADYTEVRVVARSAGTFYRVAMKAGDIYRVAGTNKYFSGDGGKALNAELEQANGLAVSPAGNYLIADYSEVRIVPAVSGTYFGHAMVAGDIYAVAGTGYVGFSGDGGPATKAKLFVPGGVALDGSGNLVIADTSNHRVRVVAAHDGTFYGQAMTAGDIYTVAGTGKAGDTGDGGPAVSARLRFPGDVAVDHNGNLIISDSNNEKLRVVAESPGVFYGKTMTAGDIYTIAGNGTRGFSGDGGPATAAEMAGPEGVTVDAAGNLVFADAGNNRVRVVAARSGTFYGLAMTAGNIYSIAGNGTAGFSGDGGPATSAELNTPWGITLDTAGNLVIADTSNNRVRVLAAHDGTFYGQAMTTGDIYTVAGNGSFGESGDGGPATAAELSNPEGVGVDGAGNLVIADTGYPRIRVVSG